MSFQYNDIVLIQWRDEYINTTESKVIIKNLIILKEIPDEVYRVRIAGYTEKTMDAYNQTKTIGINEFVVDYNTGWVTFNSSKNALTLTVSYKGKGLILYPAERIYYHHEGDNSIIKNLQELAELGQIVLDNEDIVLNFDQKINTAITLTQELEADTITANTAKTNLDASTTTANTTKTNLDASNATANTTKTNLDTSITSANTIKTNLDASNTTANTTKTNLDASNTTANTTKTNLDSSNTTANTTKTNLDNSNTTASTTKTNLDASTVSANTAKTNLDNSITSSQTAKTNLDNSITNAASITSEINTGQQLKTDLNSSISTGSTLKTNLDSAISTANTASTTLDGSVVAGQNKIEEMDAKITDANTAITNTNTAKDNANDVSTRLSVFEAYNNSKIYKPLNKVMYNNSSYVCILEATVGILPTNTTYWSIMAQKGVDGTGTVMSVQSTNGDIIVADSTSTPDLSLSESGVTAGTYTKVTVDAKGRVTTGGSLSSSDIPSLSPSIVGLGNVTNESKTTMFANPVFTGTVTLSADPASALQAATKQFVEAQVALAKKYAP